MDPTTKRKLKLVTAIAVTALFAGFSVTAASELTRQQQQQIIEDYLFYSGQTKTPPVSTALEIGEDLPPVKCGTPSIVEFQVNRDKLDTDLLTALGVQAVDRPNLDLHYDSPGGKFRIHYSVTGTDAVWQAGTDSDLNGVPDYVDTVAMVADSAYDRIVNDFGFPPPPVDTGCFEGEDSRIDIYLPALASNVYGLTWGDTDCAVPGSFLMNVPSYMVLDNDYQHVPAYRNRRLDAVRVTIAHEFFHVIQFGMDFTETAEGQRYWLEMASTWMEEALYDNINDYYAYLPWFYQQPTVSIQQFLQGSDLHPYGSVVFPIFLSEKYGNDIMRAIWFKSVELGVGPHFLESADFVIDSVTFGQESFASSFADFALWNFFTGARAILAPPGVGFSEAGQYPLIRDSSMAVHTDYPVPTILGNENPYNPQHNAASYIRFKNTSTVEEDRFWRCEPAVGYSIICGDSSTAVEVPDTTAEVWDVQDSSFTIVGGFESLALWNGIDTALYPWGVSVVYQLEAFQDSIEIDSLYMPSFPCNSRSCFTSGFRLDVKRVNRYHSITFIMTPASPVDTFYVERRGKLLGYRVSELESGDTAATPREGFTVAAASLTPYPNPAVVSQMPEATVNFRFQTDFDVSGDPISGLPSVDIRLVLNIFNVAGELVWATDTTETRNLLDFFGQTSEQLEIGWGMKNQSGNPVASGVYIGMAELYVDRRLLAEGTGKVLIIK